MDRKDKKVIINGLVEKFKHHDSFYFIDATGVTVPAINWFRQNCAKEGVVYQVAKNTLINKALEQITLDEDAYEVLHKNILKGFSGILFVAENASMPAKLIKEFRKKNNAEALVLKGAYIDGALFLGDHYVDDLSKLKSKQVLIGEIIALLQSPATRVLSALQSGKNQLAGIVQALGKQKAEQA